MEIPTVLLSAVAQDFGESPEIVPSIIRLVDEIHQLVVGFKLFASGGVSNAKEFFVVLLDNLPSLLYTFVGFNKLIANELGRIKDGGRTTEMFGKG